METSEGKRLSQIVRPLFLGVLIIVSMMVYLVENYAGVEADTNDGTAFIDKEGVQTVTLLATQGNPAYGMNRISNSESASVPEEQYQKGLSTGATWDRWPLYWDRIENEPGSFDWTYQDTAVRGVIDHGLKLNAILLGTPGFYHTNRSDDQPARPTPDLPTHSPMALDEAQTGVPLGLYEPIFTDGSDIPGPGKQINDNNKWARFVKTAVNRYKPGGVIASSDGWPVGVGVTHWEMWNEPDLIHFWDGSAADYARLLKVGYLTAKHSDPNAVILFGGLADVYSNPYEIPYLNDVLALYDQDSMAPANNYFHDIVALHNYSYSYRAWRAVYLAQIQLDNRSLANEIWLNETGVPVWDDYPGPVCHSDSPFRATMQEQAHFIIQTALYARYVDVDNIFFFSLTDECGNVFANPPYFPPDQCESDPPSSDYAGDAFGIFRNTSNAICYSQHPEPGTARPSLQAFQVLTQYFVDVEPLWRARPGGTTPYDGTQEMFSFFKPATGERIMGLWALNEETQTAVFNSTNSSQTGLLITPDGINQTIHATQGVFTLTLPAATNTNTPTGSPYNAIGGQPFLLIEQDDVPPDVTISAAENAAIQVTVEWTGHDLGSNIASYDLTVSDNGETAVPWLTDTTADSGLYAPLLQDHTYTFTIVGRDQAGNVSPQKSVSVYAPILDNHNFLPLVQQP